MAKSLQIRRNLAREARKLAMKLINNPKMKFDTGEEFSYQVLPDRLGDVITGPSCALGQIKWAAKFLRDGQKELPYVRRLSHRNRLIEAADMIVEASDEAQYNYPGWGGVTQAEALVAPLLHFADVIDVKSGGTGR